MRFRKLRIAWSIASGVLCLLLTVLWVRSYLYHDIVCWSWNLKQGIRIDAESGGASFMYIDWRSSNLVLRPWNITSLPKDQFEFFPISGEPNGYAGFLLQPLTDGCVVAVPYWFLFFIFCAGVATPWLRWSKRFSLRTLLITTTLVAVGLRLIVWLSAKQMDDDNARANENAAAGQVGSYTQGLDSYHSDVKEYPRTLKPLSASAITGWHGPYTRGFAKDPWGHDWMYVVPGKHNPDSYDIWSVGPDGVDGTADDIGNWKSK